MSFIAVVRSGAWLTADRLKSYPAMFLVIFVAASIYWLASSTDYIDSTGKPVGTDFLHHYTVSDLILDGNPEAAYDLERYRAAEAKVLQVENFSFVSSHYPPPALFFVIPLALFSYGVGLALWVAITLAFNLLAVRAIAGDNSVLIPALAFPAVIINAGHGQNGFLTCALFGGALFLLGRKNQIGAGILIGLLIYKPQFGLLFPIALGAAGYWRAFIAAAVTAIAFAAISLLAFGPETWNAFLASTDVTRSLIFEQGTSGWEKFHSWFSLVRGLGGSVNLAYALQALVILAMTYLVFRIWKSDAGFNIKATALTLGTLSSTPYLLDYDLVLLGLPVLFMALERRHTGFQPWEQSMLALLWLWPLIARTFAGLTAVQLTPVLLGLAIWVLTVAAADQEKLSKPA